jgi:hypothetical protein
MIHFESFRLFTLLKFAELHPKYGIGAVQGILGHSPFGLNFGAQSVN